MGSIPTREIVFFCLLRRNYNKKIERLLTVPQTCCHKLPLEVVHVGLNVVLVAPLPIPAGVHTLPNKRDTLLQPSALVVVHLGVHTVVVVIEVGEVARDVRELGDFGAN